MNTYIKENGFKYVILVVILILFFVYHDSIKAFLHPAPAVPTPITVNLPPQAVKTETVIVKEVAVQPQSMPGSVVTFVERAGKVIAVIDGKEIEVPNMTGKPTAELGKDGELRITQSMTAKLDVTDMANAQAKLIAQREVDKIVAEEKKKAVKIERRKNWQTVMWTVVGMGAGKLLGGVK